MTRDVTFQPTNPIMPAMKTGQSSFTDLINEQIQFGKTIFMGPVEGGEYPILWVIQQLPNGLFRCATEVTTSELRMRDRRNYPIPFTR